MRKKEVSPKSESKALSEFHIRDAIPTVVLIARSGNTGQVNEGMIEVQRKCFLSYLENPNPNSFRPHSAQSGSR